MNATRTKREDQTAQRGRTQTAPAIEPFFSIECWATLLKIGRRTVERKLSAGELPAPDLHVGKLPRWRPETVRAWIATQTESN